MTKVISSFFVCRSIGGLWRCTWFTGRVRVVWLSIRFADNANKRKKSPTLYPNWAEDQVLWKQVIQNVVQMLQRKLSLVATFG